MPEDARVPVPREAARLPERRLSSGEMEAVIRRAVELQMRETDPARGEGITEAELVRIGQELGLPAQHIQQALAEVRSRTQEEEWWFGRGFGAGKAVAARVMKRSVERVQRELDTYLRERECMVVQRRLPDRTIYAQASGVVAAVTRAAQRVGSRYPLLRAKTLEVSVQRIDEESCYVAIATDLVAQRTGLVAGGLLGGGSAGGIAGIAAAIAVAPPAALVGVPVLLGTVLASRALYRETLSRTCERLEALLDRLEHRELLPAASAVPRLGGG